MRISCDPSSTGYGNSPDCHCSIGGRNGAASSDTASWPATRPVNSASSVHSAAARVIPQAIGEHRPVMAPPVALEPLLRVVLQLAPQELGELRIRRLHLIAARPAVIGQEIAAAMTDRHVDQRTERVGAAVDAGRRVLDVQVEDGARPAVARPGRKLSASRSMSRTVP